MPGTISEGEQAHKALNRIEEKIVNMEKLYGFSREVCYEEKHVDFSRKASSASGFTNKNSETEEEKFRRLGIIYAIFGESFKINLDGYRYEVRFKYREEKDLDSAFCRVRCDILEDDYEIFHDVILGFWPSTIGDIECSDMEFSSYDSEVNVDFSRYNEITDRMMDIWNNYFSKERRKLLLGSEHFLIEDDSENTISTDYGHRRFR